METLIGLGLFLLFSAAGVALTHGGLRLLDRVAGTRSPDHELRDRSGTTSADLCRRPFYRAYPTDRIVHDVGDESEVRCPHCRPARTDLKNWPEERPETGASPLSTERRS